MNKFVGILILSLLALNTGYGQGQQKLNFRIASLMSDPQTRSMSVNVLVQGDVVLINRFVTTHQGVLRYATGDVATVKLPVTELQQLAQMSFTNRIELAGYPNTIHVPLNDSMRAVTGVNAVHMGTPPLLQGYNGKDVVIGIIDTGVDFTHPDLQDSSGNTRIKFLWDQAKPLAANTPVNYGYGQEWNNTDIDAGLANSHNDLAYYGHGTHVTGIASGDGSAINKNQGVAPNADIIVVAFDFNNTSDPTYLDAVDYIFNKAQQLGKPCVINASLGDYYGSHDGQDLQSAGISNLINQQSGRVVVAAAGNAGTIPFHLGYDITSDTSFTWLLHNASYPTLYFQVWADTALFGNASFTVGADANTTSASFSGELPYRNIFYHLGQLRQDTIWGISGNRLAVVQSFGSIQGSAYLLEMNLIPDSASYVWRWTTTGTGHFDMWKFKDGTGSPGFEINNLPSATQVPEIIHYKLPDANSTIVSGFQCLDNVITVGNFGNRNMYVDVNGNTYSDPTTIPGDLALSSSWGPTRDGRIKPDITAPGGIMLSCGVLSLLQQWALQPGNAPKVAQGGYHFRDGGTSSSSPVVAGIAALFLEQNPGADAAAVKNAIIQCAVQDTFTGNNLPDNQWGYGKVHAFNTLTNCNLTGLSEPFANSSTLIYPNPADITGGFSVLTEGIMATEKLDLIIRDALGRKIKHLTFNNTPQLHVDCHGMSEGLYLVSIELNGERIAVSKLLLTQ
ncbi:MAG TPA: S8 family peptidase [Bacteroidia bacterium]|nr:S8 family peptidase [Bacteroidia bacterium]